MRVPEGVWDGQSTRIGERSTVEGVTVRWRIPRPRRRSVTRLAVIENLSVSGVGLLVPSDGAIQVGMPADMELDGMWGRLRVVHFSRTLNRSVMFCGASFVDIDPSFVMAITKLLDPTIGGF